MSAVEAIERLREGDVAGALSMLATEPRARDAAPHHAALGMAYLANDKPAAALRSLRRAIALGDESRTTWLNYILAEDGAGDSVHALELIRDLAEHYPEWDEAQLRLAERLRRDGEVTGAEAAYRSCLDLNANRVEALLGLATMCLQQGQPEAAQLLLLRCCGVAPQRAEAWDALGLALVGTNDLCEAESAYGEAQLLEPDNFDYALRRIGVSILAGHAEAELARLEVATLVDPLDVVLLTARGVLLDRLGRRADAIDVLEAACALAPDAAIPAVELANSLIHTDRSVAAEAALIRAIALAPEQKLLRNNRAVILMRLQRHEEARRELEAVMADQGEQPGILCNLSTALTALGEQAAGVAAARRAAALAPEMHLPWRVTANASAYLDGIEGATLLDACARASATIGRPAIPCFANSRDPDRRLRVGLLSMTLKTHPVGWLTIAGFENLDPASFELVCIAQPELGDPIARRFRAVASEWHVADSADAALLATRIRALEIDLLIDLSGYGDHGLMAACAYRPAPVQLKWVGMQNHSSGLPEMDWFVTDQWETPPGTEPLYSERLLRLADGYVCYSPPPYAPEVGPLPALQSGHITFGCFNNLAKVTPRVIATWSEILHRLPSARLVVKSQQFSDRVTHAKVMAAFLVHGIGESQLELRGSSTHRSLLEQYNDIDIVLDPFPYTGGLTTCESLWMGVPTITVAGQTFSSRHATSHLSNVGLQDWIAPDIGAYMSMAIARAANVAALADLRAGLRARVKASALCDGPRFGRSLGAGLRHAWRHWCVA